MIAKRSVSDTISNENELTLRRLDEIEEQFVVWTSRFDLADKRINELRSRLELFDKKLKIEKERPNEILNNINKRFRELEVIPFGKSGDFVDHELHDALMMRSEKGKGENEILEVFEKGYRYKDRVIRHAKVVVNQTPS